MVCEINPPTLTRREAELHAHLKVMSLAQASRHWHLTKRRLEIINERIQRKIDEDSREA